MTVPPVLIEKWLPIQELGVESQRERGASSALPPLYFLHVWWARRPLTASRAAILASLLPQWSQDFPKDLRAKFPTEESYQQWFVRVLGILGDPVASKKLIVAAKAKGIKLKGNPYGYPRAFTCSPSEADNKVLSQLFETIWGGKDITFCDPMSGGGSIPFEALRYGLTVFANELNPVASVVLKATLEFPARYGQDLAREIEKWGSVIAKRLEERLSPYFLTTAGENIFAYCWARTVACPTTGKVIPLSPNWWLQQGSEGGGPVAVRLILGDTLDIPRFEIVKGEKAEFYAKQGTVSRGVGRSPWAGESVDGDYIKSTAQAHKMGQILYALVIQSKGGRNYRVPNVADEKSLRAAEDALSKILPRWTASGFIPTEERYIGPADRSANYGIRQWHECFAPRQLLALGTYLEVFHEVTKEIRASLPAEEAKAVTTYLAFAIDKAADHNSRMARWESTRTAIKGTFDRHDFSFKWSHAEFDAAHNLFPWVLSQITDAYTSIAKLAEPSRMFTKGAVDRLTVNKGNAASISKISSGTIHTIVVDPPYYDNVMYSECSDFFYVWMKRTLGDVYPEWFSDELTNKDEEAVANVARFASIGGKKKTVLADKDYELKMAACFKEMHRILRPDGALTVMFTHKRVDAWDALATALINGGFAVKSSWPIHTESEHSLHQAKKNAAASTIMLVCRKRENGKNAEPVWWDEIKGKVRRVAREKAEDFEKQGIRGVDLYISTFGPVLSVISEHWPVLMSEIDEKTRQPLTLRPDVALEIAREEVISLRKQGLLMGRTVQFDPVTDWYLMAWDSFKAEQFPADEARKLAIALGLNLEQDLVTGKRIVTKKQNYIVIQEPTARRRKGVVDPDVKSFACSLDAVHTAMLVYEEDGDRACKQFLQKSGLIMDGTFKACVQALINSIPRNKEKGKFVRPEAETLENMRLAFFDDISAPAEEEPPIPKDFQPLLAGVAEEPEAEESKEEEDEE
jgi:adenine-specific DNA methylase